MTQDDEHLRLLSIFHYVVAGIAALFSMFPVIHLAIGLTLILAPEQFESGQPPPAFVGWMFTGIAGFMILMGLSLAVLVLTAGRFLAQRRNYQFCLVMAAVACIFMPFGTVLGVFTIIVLMRDSVKQQFIDRKAQQASGSG